MRFKLLLTIYRKELTEALRDRRTLFIMVGLPILLYPLAIIGMSKLQESQSEAQKARTSRVAVWGILPADLDQRLRAKTEKIELLSWQEVPSPIRSQIESRQVSPPPTPPLDLADDEPGKRPKPDLNDPIVKAAQSAILNRKVDAVLLVWPGFSELLNSGRTGVVSVHYDSVRPESSTARDRLVDEFRIYRLAVLSRREQQRGLDKGFTEAVEIQSSNIAPEKRRTGMLLGMLLPYLLITFSVMGAFYATLDMTAGEKERGTMQTLLCAPVDPLEIITGKFGAAWTLTMISTVINLVSLAATFSRIRMIPGVEMSFSPNSYLIALLLQIPTTAMATALFLAIGAFAKDFKEGQSYLTPALMGFIMPLMITMAPGMELNRYLAFVPVINIALLVKQVFLGEWSPDLLFLVLVSAFCYAALALVFASKVFERTNLLLGGKETLGGLFDFARRPGSKPTPGLALFLFAAVLVLLFYGSLALEKHGIVPALLVSEYGFMLLPALALAAAKGFSLPETFSIRLPHWKGVLAALLIGVSGWTIAGGLIVRLLPPPDSLVKALEKILLIEDNPAPLWQVWLLIGLTPALCEEFFFRGFIQSGFRRMGMWSAILASGFLFGLAHSSIYRLFPTFFLGVLFGYAVWKTRSIFVGILCHMLNNGLMATLARSRDLMKDLGLSGVQFVPWSVIGAGAVLLAAAILLLRSIPDQSSDVTA